MQNSNKNYQKVNSVSTEINRMASLLISLICLIAAYFVGSVGVFHLVIMVVVLPLGCIWYGNEIGDFVGMSTDGEKGVGNVIGALVVIAGWIVLFSMLAMIAFFAFRRLW